MHVLDSRYDAFRNQRASKATGVENRVEISHFLTPCKIWRKMNEMAESILQFTGGLKTVNGREGVD